MSYILEALRKADAQRERHRLPGLQAHASGLPADASGTGRWMPRWAWIALAVGILSIGVLGWHLGGADPPPQESSAAAFPPPAAEPQAVVAAGPAEAPKPATSIDPPPPPAVAAPRRAPVAPAEAVAAPPTAAPSARASAAPATWPPAGAPSLVVTGGIYSPDPAQRMLIVNGQVYNEGSEVAPGVTLEKVAPRSAVLGFRGASYSVGY